MNIRTFENYINNSELNENTKKDYIGQYNQIEKICIHLNKKYLN